jgi:minor extracellular serine protease Vpr
MKNSNILLLTLTSLSLCFSSLSATAGNTDLTKEKAAMHKQRAAAKNRFIVELSGTPLIELETRAKAKAKYQVAAMGQSSAIEQQIAKAEQYQTFVRKDFSNELKAVSFDSRTTMQYGKLLNGVAIETPLTLEQVAKLPHVKNVYPVQTYTQNLMSAVPLVKAPEAWELVGGQSEAGRGIKIAIIDSGITPDHPLFDDTGFDAPATRATDDYCATTDASFCNNKLIVARFYPPYNIDYEETGEFESPKALSGHGTHVAGIAAGRQVVGRHGANIVGVAPAAYVMAYKALFGQSGSGSDVGLLKALEDAYDDGADVINNSWGGGTGGHPKYSVYKSVFERLEAAGVVLVTSAGNNGDLGNNTIGCPACIEAGIAVGSTSTDFGGAGVNLEFYNKAVPTLPATNYQEGQSFSGTAVLATDPGALGCEAWPEGSVNGKVAVVNRGDCTFLIKTQNAITAGAVGVIVVNNVPGMFFMLIEEEFSIATVLIHQDDGPPLKAYIADNPDDNVVSMTGEYILRTNPALADIVSIFSARGPNGDNGFIKPDLAAPGELIQSGTSADDESTPGELYMTISGTSMASPMVAGAAALLVQKNPTLSAKDIKGMLIGGVDKTVQGPLLEGQATPFETGSGRLNVFKSIQLTAYAETSNFANNGCLIKCTIPNALISIEDVEKTWTAAFEFDENENFISASVTRPSIVLSQKGQKEAFDVNVELSYDLPKGWYFGRLVWTSNTGETIVQGFAVSNDVDDSVKISINEVSSAESSAVYNVVTSNPTTEASFPVELILEGAAEFKADSFSFTPSESVTDLTVENGVAKYNVALPAAGYSESNDLPIDVDLASVTEAQTVTCADGCDEFNQVIEVSFDYFGQAQTQITVTDNGVAIVGNTIPAGFNTANNRELPSDGTPDGFLAPFWTDFDLLDGATTGDTGGGSVLYHTVVEGDKEYLVVQWDKVKLWVSEEDGVTADTWGVSSADIEFSFQLVIEKGSSNVWFNYLAIPEQPNFYTVGMESTDSADGYTRWFNGVGVMSAVTGENVRIEFSTAPTLTTQFTVERSDVEAPFTINDNVNVDEDSLISIDVLANDLKVERALLLAKAGDEKRIDVLFKSQSAFDLLPETLTISQEAAKGTAVVADGKINYTPNAEYYGSDIVKYTVDNSKGKSSTGTVVINVVSVNDAPIINGITAPTSATKGQKFTISVDATDSDSEIYYNWIIPAGFIATDKDAAELEVTLDRVTEATATFTVTVTDGYDEVSQSVSITTVDGSSSGGSNKKNDSGSSTAPFMLVLISMLIMFRRKARL